MDSPRECWVHDWATGNRIEKLTVDGGTWTQRVSGVDESELTFKFTQQGYNSSQKAAARAKFRDWFDADTRFLVVSWGDHIESATYNRVAKVNRDFQSITVPGRGIRTFAAERSTFGVNNYPAGDLNIVGRTHAAAASLIWERLTQWAPEWATLVDRPVNAPGTYSRDIKRDEMATGESLFQAIEAQGYEIGFRPYFTPTYAVRWQMQVQPRITVGAAVEVPLSVEKPVAKGVQITEDSLKRLTGVFYVGGGHGEDTVTAWAGNPNGRPIRDSFRYAKDIKDQAALQAMANAAFAVEKDPVEQWSLSVDVGTEFSPERAAPGRLLDMNLADDWWKEDGTYRQRVISVRGNWNSLTLEPEVQTHG